MSKWSERRQKSGAQGLGCLVLGVGEGEVQFARLPDKWGGVWFCVEMGHGLGRGGGWGREGGGGH